jgi:hypothetical protein
MLAKVDEWEHEQAQSSQSFAQNLESEIQETEQKLDKLVDAYLEGIVDRGVYLVKKDALIKTKIDLSQRKEDFGRKARHGGQGNNWIEPLREWINTAHHAEKLASSNDLDEIKSLVEKIGTNRRLLDRKVFFDFQKPFDLITFYKSSYDKQKLDSSSLIIQSENDLAIASLRWSDLLNAARTYFEQRSATAPE